MRARGRALTVEITFEGALIAVGWAVSLVCGLAVFPRIVRALIAKGLIKPSNPLRKAYALIFDQDVLPKVKALTDALGADLRDKLNDLDQTRLRVESELNAMRTEVAATRKTLAEPPSITIDKESLKPTIIESFGEFAKTEDFQKAMQASFKSAWGKRVGQANAEEEGAGAEEAVEDAVRAVKDPASAELASQVIGGLEMLHTGGLLSDKEYDKRVEQVRAAWRSGRNLVQLAQRFGVQVPVPAQGGGLPGRSGKGVGPV